MNAGYAQRCRRSLMKQMGIFFADLLLSLGWDGSAKSLNWYTGGLFIALCRPARNFLHMVPKTECTKIPLKSVDSIEQALFCASCTPHISGFQILTQLGGRGELGCQSMAQPIRNGTLRKKGIDWKTLLLVWGMGGTVILLICQWHHSLCCFHHNSLAQA